MLRARGSVCGVVRVLHMCMCVCTCAAEPAQRLRYSAPGGAALKTQAWEAAGPRQQAISPYSP